MDTTKIVEKIKYGNVELKLKTTTLQAKSVDPSVDDVTVLPDQEYGGLESVTVRGVTSDIDKNIIPGNIRKGKIILGVEGDMEPDKPDQTKIVTPTKQAQEVYADPGYELLGVEVEGVTSDIDENIQADNIRYGVEILGVVGSMEQKEDLDAELTEQDALLDELDGKIDELPDKDVDLSQTTATADDVFQGKQFYNAEGEFVEGGYKDMLQRLIDDKKSCARLFEGYPAETIPYLNKLDTSKVLNMAYMFQSNPNLTSLDLSNFNTSNVTIMNNMFYECKALTSLDLSSFNTSNVSNMSYMFCICKNLTSLDVSSFNISNVTNMQGIFSSTEKISSIDLSNWDTRNVTNMSSMFYYCYKLETVIGKLDVRNCTTLSSMFEKCRELRNITLKNIKANLTIGTGEYKPNSYNSSIFGYLLTNESLINTIQELWDNTNNALGGSRTLRLSTNSKNNIANIYVKLIPVTDEMRAEDPYIDNKKPCVVCDASDEGAMTLTEFAISKNWSIA